MNFKAILDNSFGGIVGQSAAIRRFGNTIIGSKLENGFLAPTLIVAPPGVGKTRFMAAGKAAFKAVWGDGRKAIVCPSGDELGKVMDFFADVLVPHVHEAKACIFVDEFHKTHKSVQSLFHAMIEISASRELKVVRRGELECTVNPLNHGFVFATNQVELIDPALLSRLNRIDLSLYTDEEMEQILFQSLEADKVIFNENSLRKIAECNRGTARDVIQWVNDVRLFLAINGKKSLNKKDVAEIIKGRETFPMGTTRNELATLLLLERHGPMQMKQLAARNLCGSPAEQNANERYLLARGLLEIDGVRKLTREGRAYLAQLRADGFIPAAIAGEESVVIS